MNARLSLRTRVLLLALINVVLVAAALIWFAQTQLRQGVGNLLIGEARGRLTDVAVQIAEELPRTDRGNQTDLLAQYSARHGVTFYLFENSGKQYAGPPLTLPETVARYLREVDAKTPLATLQGLRPLLGLPQLANLINIVREPPFFDRNKDGYWVVFRMPLRSHDNPVFAPGVLIMASPKFFGTPFFFDSKPWLAISGLIVMITAVCWLPIVRGATRSIGAMASATAEIAKGKFRTKVNVRRSDELGQLGVSLNRMAGQLEGYMHGQKRFLRDAAHELRSPLARMQAALGNLLESEVGPEQKPLIEDLREEIELMSSLTGELLTFAREENQQGKLTLVPVKLSEVVDRVLATENPTGGAEIRVELQPDVTVTAHAESLFRGLSNVVRNAIRYAAYAGPISIVASRQDDGVTLTITDKGPGLPEEALEMVFIPFYRLDDSRDRQTGGNGLGMSIARSCIETCGGTIYCRNANPGLQVTIGLRIA